MSRWFLQRHMVHNSVSSSTKLSLNFLDVKLPKGDLSFLFCSSDTQVGSPVGIDINYEAGTKSK